MNHDPLDNIQTSDRSSEVIRCQAIHTGSANRDNLRCRHLRENNPQDTARHDQDTAITIRRSTNSRDMDIKHFKKHQRVKYTDSNGKSEFGVVSSVNNKLVFVKYDLPTLCLISGDADYTAQATSPRDLK